MDTHNNIILQQEPVTLEQGLTFEEMVLQQQENKKADELRRQHQQNGPKPITFNSQGGYTTEVKYSTDDDTGFGFKIEVTSDMNFYLD
jgi:hypothetical protein